MKFLYYISWLPLTILDFLVSLLAYPLAPIACLFIKDEHLPKIFWFLETPIDPLYGDRGHVARWSAFATKYGRFGKYCQYVAWLWRNKAYNFAYYVTGRVMQGPCIVRGNPKVESGSPYYQPGWVLVTTAKAWGLFAFFPYLRIGNYKVCIRIYVGWKLKQLGTQPDAVGRAMICQHVNPFRIMKIS